MILIGMFKCEQRQRGEEFVLSRETTKMRGSAKARAINELVKFGLIRVRRNGKQAVRIINIRTYRI
jgi:hypothetical protein